MDFLERIFGQKILMWLFILIIGVVLYFGSSNPINSQVIAIIVIVISVASLIYESKLRMMIKFPGKKPEKFKSAGESFIAHYFDEKKIAYKYEKPLKLGKETIHPDFFLPEFDVYVEYWGKHNSGDSNYKENYRHKKQLFAKYEIPLVELYPDNIWSAEQLHKKFTERLLTLLKKDRS